MTIKEYIFKINRTIVSMISSQKYILFIYRERDVEDGDGIFIDISPKVLYCDLISFFLHI